MPIAGAFDELDDVVTTLLSELPSIHVECLQQSRARLANPLAVLPSLITFQQLGFDWRCQSKFNGKDTRFLLFFKSLSSAREMLNAHLNLRVRPWPQDGEPPSPWIDPNAVQVRLPAPIVHDLPDAEFRRIAPVRARPDRTVILRVSPQSTLAVWTGPQDEIKADYLRARWTRPEAILDFGPRRRSPGDPSSMPLSEIWPIELFLATGQAMATESTASSKPGFSFARLNLAHEVWELASAALASVYKMTLPSGSTTLNDPNSLRWGLIELSLAVGALVKPLESGEPFARLAEADDPDTFVSPFQIGWEPGEPVPRLSLTLSAPDLVPPDVAGDLLLKQLLDDDLFDEVEEIARQNLPAEPARRMRAWLKANLAKGIFLRVDRTSKRDSFLFLLHGTVAATPCAVLISIEEVVFKVEDDQLIIKDSDPSVSYVGPSERILLPWKNGWGASSAQSQLLCDAMTILLRWRLLLP